MMSIELGLMDMVLKLGLREDDWKDCYSKHNDSKSKYQIDLGLGRMEYGTHSNWGK